MGVNNFDEQSRNYERKFFKRSPLGKATLPRYVKEAYNVVGVVGEGFRKHMTAHVLRATCITFLFEAGFQFQVIARRCGHRDRRSVLAYRNNDGVLGRQSQDNMFG